MNKWIAFAVVYNQEHFIRQWVENASRYADIVLAMFSEYPWTYNPKARSLLKPDATAAILAELAKKYPSLKVVTGLWNDETEERNAAVEWARAAGGTHLLIVDTDEFYGAAEVERAKAFVAANPADYWWMSHIQLIKRPTWAIATREGLPKFQFAIDLNRVRRFTDKRTPDGAAAVDVPPELCKCYHFSYCMPDEKIAEKLASFGHAREIQKNWLKKVWPRIQPGITNFHPVDPAGWAGINVVDLPSEIAGLFAGGEGARP